jgi:hypothetical protein
MEPVDRDWVKPTETLIFREIKDKVFKEPYKGIPRE